LAETTQTGINPQEMPGGIRHLGSRLRSYFLWTPLIWLYTLVLGIISLIVSLFDPTGERQQAIARLWSRMILGTAGARVNVEGLDRVDTSKPQV
jgi:ABC-type Na+ efflux pump permease subunit